MVDGRRNGPRRLYGVVEAGVYLGTSDWSVKRLMREGELASLKLGRRRFIPVEELDAYIQRQMDADVERREERAAV